MTYIKLPRILLICTLALAGHSTTLFAQDGHTMAVHFKDLTPEIRDDIARRLHASKEARISFACVPAGILVFERTHGSGSNTSLRERTMPLLLQRGHSADISELNIGIAEAEEKCAQARHR